MITKPYFINEGNSFELIGPFFSVTAERIRSNQYSILLFYYDLSGQLTGKTLIENATDDEEVAQNLCEVHYNLVISELSNQKAGD